MTSGAPGIVPVLGPVSSGLGEFNKPTRPPLGTNKIVVFALP